MSRFTLGSRSRLRLLCNDKGKIDRSLGTRKLADRVGFLTFRPSGSPAIWLGRCRSATAELGTGLPLSGLPVFGISLSGTSFQLPVKQTELLL